MKKQNKKSKKEVLDINYLDLIPVRAEGIQQTAVHQGTSGSAGDIYLASDRWRTYRC